ncbi:MAG: 16S rRNA (guanine(527)-N(7))-methyltransferase RsmG [Gammaproteobacteria bacterium]|nr:16S rRNA (guanine(527)-N(7))-methyltransferase RsmG [Gammaproteobacteria bacterium]
MNHDELVAAIVVGAQELQQSLPTGAADKLAQLLEDLAHWGRRINLTAIRNLPDTVTGHILDSLSVQPYLRGKTVLDVGTGAGFPGLPLAIVDPGREFELLDSNGRKIGFVQHVIGKLALANVSTVKARAEDYAPGKRFDTVIARALTAIPRFIELSGHLMREDGVLLALKGKYPARELDELPDNWEYDVIELRVPGLEQHSRHLIVLKRRRSAAA